jgi:hypothetical protein
MKAVVRRAARARTDLSEAVAQTIAIVGDAQPAEEVTLGLAIEVTYA